MQENPARTVFSEALIDDIMDASSKLPPRQQRHIQDTLDALQGLPPSRDLTNFEHAVADEYTHSFDVKKAAEVVDRTNGRVAQTLAEPAVQRWISDKLVERERRSELKADYVREYIHSILELCPTDYFSQLPNGMWCVDPEDFKKVPKQVRRLVESVELKLDKKSNEIILNVKFVSKSQALALAAKYTLIEEHNVNVSQVPWAEIAADVKILDIDPIEQEIAAAAGSS